MENRIVRQVRLGRTLLVRLIPGDDLFASIEEVLRQERIVTAIIISAIGSFEQVVFRDVATGSSRPVEPAKTNEMCPPGPFEVLSLEGNVAPMDGKPVIHMHAMLGRSDGSVIGGHLFKATVFTTLEMVLTTLEGAAVSRARSDVTGLNELTTQQ